MQVSSDPFTVPPGQHLTEVEPDIYAYGSTIVATFQQGRIFEGGCSDIGFATSVDNGLSWVADSLPGITSAFGGTFPAVSDPSVVYDVAYGLWIIASLPIPPSGSPNKAFVSRSQDGLNWDDPITVATGGSVFFDKPWITCDNTPTSPFFGNCYVEWDNAGQGDRVLMSTSTDGGATWGPARTTADNASGLGGQPLVQPSGRVVVPFADVSGNISSFISDDGGNSWSTTVTINSAPSHLAAGGLRDSGLPTPLPVCGCHPAGRGWGAAAHALSTGQQIGRLIPLTRMHLTSFWGVFAAHAKRRLQLVAPVAVAPRQTPCVRSLKTYLRIVVEPLSVTGPDPIRWTGLSRHLLRRRRCCRS